MCSNLSIPLPNPRLHKMNKTAQINHQATIHGIQMRCI